LNNAFTSLAQHILFQSLNASAEQIGCSKVSKNSAANSSAL